MAKDYLLIQIISILSEQAFSIAKNTINSIKNRLNLKKVRAMLYLKSWINGGLISLKNIV